MNFNGLGSSFKIQGQIEDLFQRNYKVKSLLNSDFLPILSNEFDNIDEEESLVQIRI